MINDRVKEESMISTISTVLNVTMACQDVLGFVERKIRNPHFAVVHKAVEGIEKFVNLSNTDLKGNFFDDLDKYTESYRAVGDIVDSLSTSFLLLSNLNTSIVVLCEVKAIGKISPAKMAATINDLMTTYDTLKTYIDRFHLLPNDDYRVDMTVLTPDINSLFDSWSNLEMLRNLFADNDTISNSTDICSDYNPIHSNLTYLYETTKRLSSSIVIYGDFLNGWVQKRDNLVPPKLSASFDVFGFVFKKKNNEIATKLGDFMKRYAENEISKLDLAKNVTELKLEDLITKNEIALNSFKNDMIGNLKNDIKSIKSAVKSAYMEGFEFLVNMSQYFPKHTQLLSTARSAALWRAPYPVIGTKVVGNRTHPNKC